MKTQYSDYLVIGSGIAGLTCAIEACRYGWINILTRSMIMESNTSLAQGGIAAALAPEDSPELHFQDTMRAGAGACDPAAVRVLINEDVARFRELARMSAPFDTNAEGEFSLAREAAHSMARVVPAKGDGTGKAVAETLTKIAVNSNDICIHENTRVLELLILDGRCVGCLAAGHDSEPVVHLAQAVVLAAGGLGQLFSHTTNSRFCNGEGLAMAYRADFPSTSAYFSRRKFVFQRNESCYESLAT